MNEVYFVVSDTEFEFEQAKTLVVKCCGKTCSEVVESAKRQGAKRVWIAKAIAVEEQNIIYKRTSL